MLNGDFFLQNLEIVFLMDYSCEIGHSFVVVIPNKTAEAMREVQQAQEIPEDSFAIKRPCSVC